MARYPIVGGPCDGQQSFDFTIRPPVGYTLICKSAPYTFGRDEAFHPRPAGDAPPSPDVLDTHQVEHAWSRLNRNLALGAATALHRSRAARARLRRRVR